MDTGFPDWNTEIGVEFPVPSQRRPLGSANELVELLWQNGEVVLQSQTNRKQRYEPTKSKQELHKNDQSTSRASENPSNLIQDDETVSWIHCPIDESFEKEFCANFFSEIPTSNPVVSNELSEQFEGAKVLKFGASDVSNVFTRSDFAPLPLPPPKFETFDAGIRKTGNQPCDCSVMTIGSSHCASNQVTNEVEENGCGKLCSFWKTRDQSNETNRHKRKKMDVGESESQSDATELESAAANKSSQRSGISRKSRVAEVHNLSERRRRDRINDKMRALQELIPHSNKSDKASMLDEAIEYMKSLQLQLQLMWMGSGMAPMMLPGMQHYMARIGMGIGPPTLPVIQNLMRVSRLPQVDPTLNQAPMRHSPMLNPVNYQNQMQNSSFPEQYANYMSFHSMQNTSQPMDMFNFGCHSAQQNHVFSPPPGNGNGSIG